MRNFWIFLILYQFNFKDEIELLNDLKYSFLLANKYITLFFIGAVIVYDYWISSLFNSGIVIFFRGYG